METIEVYHSLCKSGLLVAGCFEFAALGLFVLIEVPMSNRMMSWLALLFGFVGLFMLWLMLKERISHTPRYLITDESLIINTGLKTQEVRFADVERFFLINVSRAKMIGIKYKKGVALQKIEDASKVGRAVRRFNEYVAGSQECILADNLTIKSNALCGILN